MLAILALESRRAGAYIVGEDLGTVEPGVRKRLADLRVLSYRLLWFENSPPSEYPELSLAAVTTHDLPTIAGLWSGSDLDDQRQLGLEPNEQGHREIRERLSAMAGLSKETRINRVIERTYQLLAEAPSMIVTATLEDALAVEERPNMPATTDDRRRNWSLALPVPLERLETHDLVRAVAGALNRRQRRM
jgi:4-alpha-glucanotransferase